MRISDSLIQKLLIDAGKADSEKLKKLRDEPSTAKSPLQDLVLKEGLVNEKELTQLFANEIDVPYIDLNPKELKREVLMLIPERIARQYNAILFNVEKDGTKMVALDDPDDIQAIGFLQKQLGEKIKVHIAPGSVIQQALDQYRGNFDSELTKITTEEDKTDEDAEADEQVSEEDVAEDSPIAQTVNLIIEYAVKSGASDIHIEPRENYVVVRYRIDGILKEANKLPKKVIGALVSRIKILSNLKIDERRAPQDGRFKIQIGPMKFGMRVSTLPIVDGEKVVMRILNETSKALTLDQLGYWGIAKRTIEKAVAQPHGMVLVTGPTGSGKSTSLFSVLSMLNDPKVNISTVEDPVEYRIPGTNQTQVNPQAGMTFINGLRALLRQDPNIIMVGEIRDGETAGLGVQAALTGHLVFSTLHTNNAATCLPRLLDMGIEPFLIASTVRAVVGQRLVRRLCVDCRETVKPTDDELKRLTEVFHIDNKTYMKYINGLEKEALDEGIGKANKGDEDKKEDKPEKASDTDQLSSTESEITKIYRAHQGGCDSCNHTGYKGRMGIYEVLDNSSAIQRMIVANDTSENIQNQAIKDGMVTMQLDGFIKALRGQTSIEEILRVTSQD